MVSVIVSHECKNYSDWRKVFDADEVNRLKAGFKITGVYHSVDNDPFSNTSVSPGP